MLIINANIFTIDSENIPNGYIEIENKKIKSVGSMESLGEYEKSDIFDAKGRIATPGFIDCHTHLGLFGDGIGVEGEDGNEISDPITPHLRAIDAINPMDAGFKEALAAGVTTVLTGPGSANPIGGQIAAIRTYGRRIDDMIINPCAGIKFALGENPKGAYAEKDQSPTTRMATAALIRENLYKAKEYAEKIARSEKEEDFDKPDYDIKLEALVKLLEKQFPAHFHVHRADDIFTAIRIAKEFDIDYVLVHCTEGHLIADKLAAEKARAVVGPFMTDRPKPELANLTSKTPAVLSQNGVLISICTDHPVTPLKYLPLCASMAVKEGMSETAALRAITLDAAKIAGIDSILGSITVGKFADIVIHSGNPLDFNNKVNTVFICGEKILG